VVMLNNVPIGTQPINNDGFGMSQEQHDDLDLMCHEVLDETMFQNLPNRFRDSYGSGDFDNYF
jgi:hypothetical protein